MEFIKLCKLKKAAPAPWAATEPETTGQNSRPNQINAAVVLPTIINIKNAIFSGRYLPCGRSGFTPFRFRSSLLGRKALCGGRLRRGYNPYRIMQGIKTSGIIFQTCKERKIRFFYLPFIS